ncbi:MAG TPA: substrate-binding domain-containing protein [Anaeromyxobacter sp.]|nr:substrate-binding domain-containing protein [Anaeromyxobacter sp.]
MAPRVLFSQLDRTQEYQQMQEEEGRAAAARAGLEAEAVYCQNDPATQLEQVSRAMRGPEATRPVAVIIQPAAVAGLEALAREAARTGVGWVAMDSAPYLEGLQREFPGKLLALVSPDQREIGRMMAKLIRAVLPRGGRIVHLEGPSLVAPVIHRRIGMMEVLKGSGVEVVKTLTGDWGEASGEKATTFWLKLGSRKERPDLVAAQNDAMATGAWKALRALKPEWGDVPLIGCDGLPNGGQRLVRENMLLGTVVQPTTFPASVEAVVRSLHGEAVAPATLLAPSIFPALEQIRLPGRA